MPTTTKQELLKLLRNNSLKRGEFILSSGAKSDIYFDCKLTTLDSYGIWKVGEVMLDLIRRSAMDRGVTIDSVGGLTMGADSIAQAVGMLSVKNGRAIQFFSVRKTPKRHGQTKLIEGSFKPGDTVVIIDDVITNPTFATGRGQSRKCLRTRIRLKKVCTKNQSLSSWPFCVIRGGDWGGSSQLNWLKSILWSFSG